MDCGSDPGAKPACGTPLAERQAAAIVSSSVILGNQ
jgi:hypothetical protein